MTWSKHLESGVNETAEYGIWRCMINRCTSPTNRNYKRYGKRGVTVCDRWRYSYANFLQDVGRRPSSLHTLDRFPDPSGSYEPKNVRWATPTQQARNRTNSRVLTVGEITQSTRDWEDVKGLPPHIVKRRIDSGWPISDLFLPPQTSRIRKRP